MKKAILLLLTVFIIHQTQAQEESSWWVFGDEAAVEFTPNPQNRSNEPFIAGSGFDQDEGVASISDENGNLLFFTNGQEVHNRNGQIMPNGTGLFGNFSSTQSAIIVKAPETAGVYFIFTVGNFNTGLAYSRVEMQLNGGLGDIVAGVKNIVLLGSSSEKVAATIQTGSNNAYVMTYAESNASINNAGSGDYNALFTWEVRGIPGPNVSFVLPSPIAQSANGNLPYFQTTLGVSGSENGALRVSPDGTKIAIANHNFGTPASGNGCYLYEFNPANGQFGGGNGVQLDNNTVYGVEFSASSQYLYHDISTNYNPPGTKQLAQYDLCDPANIVSSRNVFSSVTNESRGTLQLGKDGSVYVARMDQSWLGRIDNSETSAPTYDPFAVDLSPGVCKQGLPVFIQSNFQSFFTVNDQCQGDVTEFILSCLPQVAASNWDFGDGNTLTVTGPGTVTNTYASAGTYTVTVNVTNVSGDIRDFTQEITIYENGIVDPIDTTLLDYCDDDGSGDEIVDLSQFTADVLGTQDAAIFDISYHGSMTDADTDMNPLPTNFNASLGTNEIWVRIENTTSPIDDGCSAIGSFTLTVSSVPTVSNLPDYELCDDLSQDGVEYFDLAAYLPTIATQAGNPVDVDYTIHESQTDADMGMGALDTSIPYPNTMNPHILYVRLQNTNDADCYGTAPFNLVVLTAPSIGTPTDIEVCDDAPLDGSSNFTLTNQDNVILNGNTGTVSYHASQADADSGNAALSSPYSVTGTETVYARLVDDIGCVNTTSFNITVLQLPSIGTPADIEVCDDVPLDGISDFILTDQDNAVLNGNSGTVTYHNSQSDAENGNAPLSSPYSANDSETIYVRLVDHQGCVNTTSFDIFVIEAPIGFAPDLTNICDDNTDLNQNFFDLSIQDTAILNGLDPSDYTISYYATDDDAQNSVNELSTNYTVPFQANVNTGVLYARLENNNTGCFSTSQFTIIFERCEIIFPEGFSPNGDGINDTFSIPGLAEQFPRFNLKIYNRHGVEVFETSATNYEEFAGLANKGMLSGDGLLPVGTYFYVIQYNDTDKEDASSWLYINY